MYTSLRLEKTQLEAILRGEEGSVEDKLFYLEGIYEALLVLLPGREPLEWLKKPNQSPTFQGKAAIDLMTTGDIRDLRAIWVYLQSQLY